MSQSTIAQSWSETAEFESRIFDVILYFASEEGIVGLPNKEAGLLLPMVSAVVEYLGGDTSKMPKYPDSLAWTDNWVHHLNKAVKTALNATRQFSPNLVKAMNELLDVEWKHDHGESWWKSGIRTELMFRQRGFEDTFQLTHREVLKIQEDIRSNITPSDLEHCKQIGLLMRKHILATQAAE